MEKFTITSPIINIETEAEEALIQKLYPGICRPGPQNCILIAREFTPEELADLKTQLAIVNGLASKCEAKSIIYITLLNKGQARYLMGRSKDNEIYDYGGGAVIDGIDDLDKSQGPWDVKIQEVLTPEQAVTVFEELNKLK